MIFNIFYDFSLIILSIAFLPKMLYQIIFKKKYRSNFGKRLGLQFPHVELTDKKTVWIHAVSVGETKAIAPLAKLLHANNYTIIISSITETGHAEAKRCMPFAEYHVYLPFDFSLIMKPILKKIHPDLVILCETDFWYNFLRFSKKYGAKIVLVNGKVSEKSMQRWKRCSFFSKKIFNLFDLLCLQGKLYKQRFEEIGIPPNKMIVTGNLKLDEEYPKMSSEEVQSLKSLLGIFENQKVLVVGSTHDPEEKLILGATTKIWQSFPDLKLIIVPRHPERFNAVSSLFESQQIPFVRYSKSNEKKGSEKAVLIDTMGLLRKVYQIADIAIVGGSFTERVGGHNILEPSRYGVPVLYGPHMHMQPDLLALAKEYQTGLQVEISELEKVIQDLLDSEHSREKYMAAANELISNSKGATERTWQQIKNLKISSF